MLVVGGAEANGRLLTLMTHINAHEHGLLRNLAAERHAPEVTAELSVHLPDDVEEDTVVVLGDGAIGDELRDNWGVTVDLILKEGVEVLMISVIRHDDQEDEIGVFDGTIGSLDRRQDFLVVVVLDARCERLKQVLFMLSSLIQHRADVGVLNADIEALLE